MSEIEIICDASFSCKTGVYGWAAKINRDKVLTGAGYTSNANEAEALAAIHALEAVEASCGARVTIRMDSTAAIARLEDGVRKSKALEPVFATAGDRFARCVLRLKSCDVTIEHVKGHRGANQAERVHNLVDAEANRARRRFERGSMLG